MNINLNNYEAYFLDYHEGNLSTVLIKELMEFITIHPELKEEFESFEPVTLKDTEGIRYESKETLKKHLTSINPSNFEEHAINSIEGTLPPVLQQELRTFINQYPRYKKELELYSNTKLTPDTSVVFDDKISLKRTQRRPATLYYWSAAASVAVIIIAYFMLNRNLPPAGNNIATHTLSKDSNAVASHATKAIDSNMITPKSISNIAVKPNSVAINVNPKKQNKNNVIAPNNSIPNSTIATARRESINIQALPGITKKPIPVNFENSFAMSFDTLKSTAFINDWIMKYHANNSNQPEADTTAVTKEKSGSKFLYLLAKITCKGLHKITGEHIKMEKKYDSDTTNIIAYQFDLGKKKFEFPVKE